MNAHSSIAASKTVPTKSADYAFALWRGRYLAEFAKLENVCFAAVLHLMPTGGSVDYAANFGTCLKAFGTLTSGSKGDPSFDKILLELDDHRKQRNVVVHGRGDLIKGPSGRWIWHFECRTSASNTDRGTIASDELESILNALRVTGQKVRNLIFKMPRRDSVA